MGGGSWDADAVLTILLLGQMEDGNEGRGGEGKGGSGEALVHAALAQCLPYRTPFGLHG